MDDASLRKIFQGTKVIASVGLSSNLAKPSFHVCSYLQRNGYRVIPVNPNETEVLGEKAYPDIESIPAELKIDVVQVFRRPEAVPDVVKSAIRRGVKVVWMQDGAGNADAARIAEGAGMTVVVDDCMMRQHARLFGA